jgi:hypothetical protein
MRPIVLDRCGSLLSLSLPTYKLEEPVKEDGVVQWCLRILQLLPQRPEQQAVAKWRLLWYCVSHAGHCVHDA